MPHVSRLIDLAESYLDAQDALEAGQREDATRRVSELEEAAPRCEELLSRLDAALELEDAPATQLTLALFLPPIYDSESEQKALRARVQREISRLHRRGFRLREELPYTRLPLNFFSAYQGLNERAAQEKIATFYHHLYDDTPRPRCRRARPRVGFLSSSFRASAAKKQRHTINKLFGGVIERLSRDAFEVTVIRAPGTVGSGSELGLDVPSKEILELSGDLAQDRQRILRKELDALIFTDIGMEAYPYLLAFTRFAPVQCVTWGHPITTGIKTVDYFLSSRDLETPEAQAHYSETLVRLDNLTNYYLEPATPAPESRESFGLRPEWHVYSCVQTLFKLHPAFDGMLRNLLRNDAKAHLVLLSVPERDVIPLRQRFRRELGEGVQRVHFLPPLSAERFLNLCAVSDVLLDPIHFGGGNTSYEGFAMGSPIVTLPGGFLRSRITFALYRRMGMDDLIARDEEDYVRLALRLGNDARFREAMRGKILERKHLLYRNESAVRELKKFLNEAIAERQGERLEAKKRQVRRR